MPRRIRLFTLVLGLAAVSAALAEDCKCDSIAPKPPREPGGKPTPINYSVPTYSSMTPRSKSSVPFPEGCNVDDCQGEVQEFANAAASTLLLLSFTRGNIPSQSFKEKQDVKFRWNHPTGLVRNPSEILV